MLTIQDPSQGMFTDLRSINDEQKAFIQQIRDKANEMVTLLDELPVCRRKSIALTELETCVMFAIKAACFGK